MRYPSGTMIYDEVANVYESPHFCEIVLEGKTVSFDVLFKRIVRNDCYRFCYVECKYVGSIKSMNQIEGYVGEFLEKVYASIQPTVKNHRGNVDFIFVSSFPVTYRPIISPDTKSLTEHLRKRGIQGINMERIHLMTGRLKYMHVPMWVLEPYRTGAI